MSAAPTERQGSTPAIEEELHELEESSDALDQRTGNLEMRGGFMALFTFLALAVAIAALAVSLVNVGNTKTKTVIQTAPQAATATPAAPASATPAPASAGTVSVGLGEMFVRPNVSQAAAGKVTFNVHNTGKLVHEMIVAKAPVILPAGAAKASEKNSVGEVAELQPGTAGSVKLMLRPGNYILFCNVPGHYAAGQHVAFTVH